MEPGNLRMGVRRQNYKRQKKASAIELIELTGGVNSSFKVSCLSVVYVLRLGRARVKKSWCRTRKTCRTGRLKVQMGGGLLAFALSQIYLR